MYKIIIALTILIIWCVFCGMDRRTEEQVQEFGNSYKVITDESGEPQIINTMSRRDPCQ